MSSSMIPRKPLPPPAQAHLKDGSPDVAAAAFGPGFNAPVHHQDALSEQQKKETAIDDSASSIEQGATGGALSSTISRHLDNLLPPHKRYFNNRISRRTLLIIIGASFILLLALIVGLAVGLSGKSDDIALPLPGGAQTFEGDLTYYNPGLGACGQTHGDGDPVVAVSHILWDKNQVGANPNTNSLCGRKIRAHRVDERTGKDASIDVTVIDRCTGCKPTDLDVSPAMFKKLADPDLGRVKVEWAWL
ncbi:RlpA-like double-psi beta-barrel-protein domain-containing protein-containing protein [Bipolaris maydis]|nr:RlpA-like double-psi beta-barrel-protein domain-containing protein-containing protein [Bipolaris maydis]KAJ6195007.1 RlpA-like double-psi beta-barrel-protein domain-containing protein-containing protein [Bipolaris maydis]KAJ6207070.1 hypothetical protein PSV09DRAFT_2408054 [Bipolaris maydis]